MKTQLRQKLFDYFANNHDIQLMDSDFNEIENIILPASSGHICKVDESCGQEGKGKEECKNEIAKRNNFDSFEKAIRHTFNRKLLESEEKFINKIIDEAMDIYRNQNGRSDADWQELLTLRSENATLKGLMMQPTDGGVSKERVLSIVDACFHEFVSSYRTEAAKAATEMLNRI